MIAVETIVNMFEREAEGEAKEMNKTSPATNITGFKLGYMIGCFEDTMRLVQEKNPELYEEIKQRAKSRQPK